MVKKLKKQYETPDEGWSADRIRREDEIMEEYGLKNKKEVYKAESELRSLRREARKLIAEEDETQTQDLIERVSSLGLVPGDAGLEDILVLNINDILDRRIQTAVNRRGYADTAKEARQLVVHGHIFIDGKRVNIPGYLLTKEEEKELELVMPEPEPEQEESKESSGENDTEEVEDTNETETSDDDTVEEEQEENPEADDGEEEE